MGLCSRKKGKKRVGAKAAIPVDLIRWDQLSGTTLTRKQEEPFLQRYKARAPWYAKVVNGALRIRPSVATVIKAQMRFTVEAKADGFVFNGPPESITGDGYGLLKMYRAFLKLPVKQVKYSWAIFGRGKDSKGKQRHWNRSQENKIIKDHVAMTKSPHWRKINNRPVIYVLRPECFGKDFVPRIREEAKRQGATNPFIVAQPISHAYKKAAEYKAKGYDGFSDYGPSYGAGTDTPEKANSYRKATGIMLGTMKLAKKAATQNKITYVPAIVPMWNPKPRKHNKDAYHHYQDPKPGDWARRLEKALALIEGPYVARQLLIYGLGENSEGGTIMPLFGGERRLLNETKQVLK